MTSRIIWSSQNPISRRRAVISGEAHNFLTRTSTPALPRLSGQRAHSSVSFWRDEAFPVIARTICRALAGRTARPLSFFLQFLFLANITAPRRIQPSTALILPSKYDRDRNCTGNARRGLQGTVAGKLFRGCLPALFRLGPAPELCRGPCPGRASRSGHAPGLLRAYSILPAEVRLLLLPFLHRPDG